MFYSHPKCAKGWGKVVLCWSFGSLDIDDWIHKYQVQNFGVGEKLSEEGLHNLFFRKRNACGHLNQANAWTRWASNPQAIQINMDQISIHWQILFQA